MALETITALYLTLSLTVTMPCIAHNTQHCCLWIFARRLIQCHTKSYCTVQVTPYGIRRPAYALTEYYLTSRNQFVTFSNILSSAKPINIVVSQGSILGPLLFQIYINDLPNTINSTPRLFADDTCLIL